MGDGLRDKLTTALTRLASEQGSGALRALAEGGRVATLWLRDGRVVDCDAEGRVGEAAFHRLLRWTEGELVSLPGARPRAERIRRTTRELFLEAERRREAWDRLVERLPPLTGTLQIDYLILSDRLGEVPDEMNAILRLVDGRRTVLQVVEEAPGDELDAATALIRLVAEGLLRTVSAAREAAPPGPPRIVHFPARERAGRASRHLPEPYGGPGPGGADRSADGRLPSPPGDDEITLVAPPPAPPELAPVPDPEPAPVAAAAAHAAVVPGVALTSGDASARRVRRPTSMVRVMVAAVVLAIALWGLWRLARSVGDVLAASRSAGEERAAPRPAPPSPSTRSD